MSNSLSQNQKQVQKQIQRLSQVQITALNYLAMGNEDLREEIYRAVSDNPALEIVREPVSYSKYGNPEEADKFQQILVNLIENSAKYSVQDYLTEIKTYQKSENVYIEISNTGLGIDEADYEKIFTKFARIDNPLTRKVQGSGLGLYITKTLAEQMEGKIKVKSTPISEDLSKITFTLIMPVKTLEEQARIKCSQ